MTACVDPYTSYWDKPGAPPTEWEQVKAECMLEGAQKVPVAATYTMQPGTYYRTNNCHKDRWSCASYGTSTPPSYQMEDANATLRDQVVRGCLARNGWVERKQG